jgi:Cu/Ag efflux protein CusF
MKTLRTKKPFSLVAVILFTLFLTSASIALADDSVMVVSGTVVSVDPNSGKVAVINESGQTIALTASPDYDLKAIQKGDKVTVEYDKKSVIKAINVQQ